MRAVMRLKQSLGLTQRCSNAAAARHFTGLASVETTTVGQLNDIDMELFRRNFLLEKPLLIQTADRSRAAASMALPAAGKWFSEDAGPDTVAMFQYLSAFGEAILPYELLVDPERDSPQSLWNLQKRLQDSAGAEFTQYLSQTTHGQSHTRFHRFSAPLSLFLQACNSTSKLPLRLYIAQAQISDLPKRLQEDLPTPRIVREAGKGDIYDANLWMGIPPTYTPLHKDPNPNLFVQIASSKSIRLFRPETGRSLLYDVQRRLGQRSSSSFRGHEMMEDPERGALEEVTWGDSAPSEGFEVTVSPGDALFIPKGYWHSIKSIGTVVNASVNWWFR